MANPSDVCFTSRSNSGSWRIRGVQLGGAVGGRVELHSGSDLTILVKRGEPRGRVIWDVVDAWPQPEGNYWGRTQALDWLESEVRRIRPVGIVAATEAMARDCERFGVPVLALPHHARPGQAVNPVREKVRVVGYEGGVHYLGAWRPLIEDECRKRGWRFTTEGPLADMDIVVGLRDMYGYPPAYWKSNVKLANAQATGTPCVLSPECGYRETSVGVEQWANDAEDLRAAFDYLTPYPRRVEVSRTLRTGELALAAIAERYRAWLSRF